MKKFLRKAPLCLMLALLLMPLLGYTDSLSLPIRENFAYTLIAEGEAIYATSMEGHLYRYRPGDKELTPLPLARDRGDSVQGAVVINGGVYYLYYDSNVLQLMYAEKDGLPETIVIPTPRDVKGASEGSLMTCFVREGDALWFLLDKRSDDNLILCRYDLNRDQVTAFEETKGVFRFALLPDGKVALGYNMYVKEKLFGRLAILDTASGKVTGQTDIEERPDAMAFDTNRGEVLFVSQSRLWAWPLSGQPREVRRMPVNGNGWYNPAFMVDGKLLSIHTSGLYLADLNPNTQGSLHVLGESPGFPYTGGGYTAFMNQMPDVNLSFQGEVDPNTRVHTGEPGHRIKMGMLPFDVMMMSSTEFDLPALIHKGYCLDLSQEADLMDAVNAMYPSIRDQVMVDGKLYALPLMVVGVHPLAYVGVNLEHAGLSPDELPESVEGMIRWIGSWPRDLRDVIKPLDGTDMAAGIKSLFIDRFIAYRYSQYGELDFTDRLFLSTLNLIESQRIPKFAEQMPMALSDGGSGLMNEEIIVLPLTEDGPKVQPARLFLYFVNSQTKNAELAISYLRTALSAMKPQYRALLFPDWTQPVERENYPDWLEEMGQEERLLRDALSKETPGTPAARAAEERLSAHLKQVEEQQAFRRYRISPQTLRYYQEEIAPYLVFLPINPFTAYHEPGGESIYQNIQRYVKGQQPAKSFAEELDQKAKLMNMEGGN